MDTNNGFFPGLATGLVIGTAVSLVSCYFGFTVSQNELQGYHDEISLQHLQDAQDVLDASGSAEEED